MKIQININGKNINAEISEEQAKILGLIEDKPETGYEGREECNNKKHYFVNTIDLVIEDENTVLFDQNRYDVGNYYSDETIAENNARADRLLRCLRQWQALHDQPITVEDWEEETEEDKFSFFYDYTLERILISYDRSSRYPNVIYFSSPETAYKAIKQFEGELKWYFTEYTQRLDEV